MSKVYKILELVGTSANSTEDAITNAIEKAAETVRGISWFEVIQIRGAVGKNNAIEYQVTLKAGFGVED